MKIRGVIEDMEYREDGGCSVVIAAELMYKYHSNDNYRGDNNDDYEVGESSNRMGTTTAWGAILVRRRGVGVICEENKRKKNN